MLTLVQAAHRGESKPPLEFVVAGVTKVSAEMITFGHTDKTTGQTREISVADYYRNEYNVRLQ